MMERTRTDHSGLPKNKLPPVPKLEISLYHWSPTSNRANILKYGLLTHKKTLQGDWRPPYICFCDDPLLGWVLSGKMFPEINSWDLWFCYLPSQTSFNSYEIITDTFPDTGRKFVKEYRVYSRLYKRDLKYIATRTQ